MSKVKYSATFSSGLTVTRTSERSYGVAWMTSCDRWTRPMTGFSRDVSAVVPFKPTGEFNPIKRKWRALTDKELADINFRVEIVPVSVHA